MSLQGLGKPLWGDRETCPGGGRCVLKGLLGRLRSSRPGHTGLGETGGLAQAVSGQCVLKGLQGGLQSSRPGHTTLGGQGVPLRQWSVRPEGPARGLQSSRPEHTSWGTRGPAQAAVGVSSRACEGGCNLQGPGTPAWGNEGSYPGGGRCILKGLLRGLQSSRPGNTSLGGTGVPAQSVVSAS